MIVKDTGFDLKGFEGHLSGLSDRLKSQLSKLPSGRASIDMLDSIDVTTNMGGKQRIKHVANVSVMDHATLKITPFNDHDNALLGGLVESLTRGAIRLNAYVEGKSVIVKLSENSEERKCELRRAAHQAGEECKQQMRSLRAKAIQEIKTSISSENERERIKKDIEKKCKEWEAEVVKLVDLKAKEIS